MPCLARPGSFGQLCLNVQAWLQASVGLMDTFPVEASERFPREKRNAGRLMFYCKAVPTSSELRSAGGTA